MIYHPKALSDDIHLIHPLNAISLTRTDSITMKECQNTKLHLHIQSHHSKTEAKFHLKKESQDLKATMPTSWTISHQPPKPTNTKLQPSSWTR